MFEKNNTICSLKKQSGISLIEIMIALVIGMILIAGISQIYIANKQTYRLQESISYVNNNARFALFFLQDAVTAAGYKGNADEDDKKAFPAVNMAGCNAFEEQQYINSATNVAGDTGLFCVKMKAPDYSVGDIAQMVDCVGRAVAAENTVTTRFSISTDGEFSCGTSHHDEAGTITQALQTQPLVSDVVITPAADLRYGEDTDNDNAVNSFFLAAAVTDWKKVIAVNIQVNLSSNEDTTGAIVTTDGDVVQRNFSRTIALRSRTNPTP